MQFTSLVRAKVELLAKANTRLNEVWAMLLESDLAQSRVPDSLRPLKTRDRARKPKQGQGETYRAPRSKST